jgi:hypothetical protein
LSIKSITSDNALHWRNDIQHDTRHKGVLCDIQHNNALHYAECRIFSVMLSVVAPLQCLGKMKQYLKSPKKVYLTLHKDDEAHFEKPVTCTIKVLQS